MIHHSFRCGNLNRKCSRIFYPQISQIFFKVFSSFSFHFLFILFLSSFDSFLTALQFLDCGGLRAFSDATPLCPPFPWRDVVAQLPKGSLWLGANVNDPAFASSAFGRCGGLSWRDGTHEVRFCCPWEDSFRLFDRAGFLPARGFPVGAHIATRIR